MDDEPLNIELIEGVLSNDYEVIKASSGIDALIKMEETMWTAPLSVDNKLSFHI